MEQNRYADNTIKIMGALQASFIQCGAYPAKWCNKSRHFISIRIRMRSQSNVQRKQEHIGKEVEEVDGNLLVEQSKSLHEANNKPRAALVSIIKLVRSRVGLTTRGCLLTSIGLPCQDQER